MAEKVPSTVGEMFPSKWLRASDLTKPVAVTVESVTAEKFRQPDGAEVFKPVVSFEGKRLRLIANKTQALALAALAGSERFEDWVGCRVKLAPGRAQNGKSTIVILAALKVKQDEPDTREQA